MSARFENDPEFSEAVRKPVVGRRARVLDIAGLVVILMLLMAFLVPATRSGGREAARRAQCTNNLKQIGLALHNYEAVYNAFPPPYTVDAQGQPLHSWRTLILPYLGQESLYRTIDLAKPWNDPVNARALATEMLGFRCPKAKGSSNTTTYLGIVGPDSFWVRGKSRRLAEITDGRDSTLMLIEADDEHAVPWMAPVDADESLFLSLGPSAKVHHPGGMNVGMVDGSARFLKADTRADVRRSLVTVSGGEPVTRDEW